jgi:hypothetical protein
MSSSRHLAGTHVEDHFRDRYAIRGRIQDRVEDLWKFGSPSICCCTKSPLRAPAANRLSAPHAAAASSPRASVCRSRSKRLRPSLPARGSKKYARCWSRHHRFPDHGRIRSCRQTRGWIAAPTRARGVNTSFERSRPSGGLRTSSDRRRAHDAYPISCACACCVSLATKSVETDAPSAAAFARAIAQNSSACPWSVRSASNRKCPVGEV